MSDQSNQPAFVAAFIVLKSGTVSYEMQIQGPSRKMLALHIANVLKNRNEGSLLDIALSEADSVVADCFSVEEVMAYRNKEANGDNHI